VGLAIFLVALYFLPTLIAAVRNHHNFTPVLLVNLLLGWTVIGWVVALIWSSSHVPRQLTKHETARYTDRKLCKHCGADVPIDATICRKCGKDPGQITRVANLNETFFGDRSVCMNCSALLDDDARVCPACGKGVAGSPPLAPQITPAATARASAFCSQCGKPWSAGALFCPQCGAKLA
jgi:ribosomal protein L40E